MKKLLIANRGEIALRVIRTAKRLGLETVAVYSEADAESRVLEEADQAVLLGPPPATESYLRQDRLVEAAQSTGADAIHPGYGFLSENAEFAEKVIDAGMIWVGARPETLRAMGDKERAREIARKAGVPVVPGSERIEDISRVDIEAIAEAVGFPLLVKASAGGGGIGMRRVEDGSQLRATAEATQALAGKSFNDGTIFLERYVPKARHIEMQVFGFGNGDAIHLFERDCSLQRRFQKVIEESPAPGLRPEVRDRMCAAALALCKATRYAGAGTIEFIVDTATQEFFFLEMNTRIQVEHPVTEMVTGVDLVAMQLDFARGALRGLDQADIASNGHAVECRLYAEKPEKNFIPSPGQLQVFRLPDQADDLRIDCAYKQGNKVTFYYDPMIAKIIAHGPDRNAACRRAVAALNEIEIEGISTNRDFLIACLRDGGFLQGDVYTNFIDDHRVKLLSAEAK